MFIFHKHAIVIEEMVMDEDCIGIL